MSHASETGGPVLELACGTGRLLCALAEAGLTATGLDLSETMLGLARERRDRLTPEVRARVRLVRGDMADFDLDGTFGLVVIADNSFRELETREELVRCLVCARRHLAPGGRLLVTERRFDPSLYPGGVREHDWSEPVDHPETGALVRRRIRVEVDLARMRMRGTMWYRTAVPGGAEVEEECRFEGLVMRPEDYFPLFAEAGLEARLFVDYGEREDDGDAPNLCFVAEPVQSP
jgi:SAM-dependent methyltransferase